MGDPFVANRRWTILELLDGDPDHPVEAGLLRKAVGVANRTHRVDLETVRKDLSWLNARMLVTLDRDGDRIHVQPTERGRSVARRETRIDGVDESP